MTINLHRIGADDLPPFILRHADGGFRFANAGRSDKDDQPGGVVRVCHCCH